MNAVIYSSLNMYWLSPIKSSSAENAFVLLLSKDKDLVSGVIMNRDLGVLVLTDRPAD